MKAPPARWSGGVIALHWLSAAWLALVFALGLAATAANLDAARKFDLYQTHKALGWLTLVLLAARLAARASRAAPPPAPNWSRATRWAPFFRIKTPSRPARLPRQMITSAPLAMKG